MPTEKECSGCGRVAAVGPDVAFCFKCGSALVDAQPPPPDPEPKKDEFGLRLRKGGFIGNDRVRQRHVESHAIPLKVSETEHLTPCNNAPPLELSKVGNTLYQPPLLSNARSIIAGWGWRRRLLAVAGTLFGTSVVALVLVLPFLTYSVEQNGSASNNWENQLYFDMAVAEDRGDLEALKRSGGCAQDTSNMDVATYPSLSKQLMARYGDEVLAKHGVSREQWSEIMLKGAIERWAMPDPPTCDSFQ